MVLSSALTEIGIKLDAQTIRKRLAQSKQETDTLRRLLRIAERVEQRESPSQTTNMGREINA